jgi:ribosome recycling factor
MISEDDFYLGRDQMQKLTDDYIKKIDEIGAAKEKEILEV